jgi:hypothetical protein
METRKRNGQKSILPAPTIIASTSRIFSQTEPTINDTTAIAPRKEGE